MYWDIFISHSSNDKNIANHIAEALLKEYHVWYDSWNILSGNDFKETIKFGLKYSKFGIILLSKNFFNKYKDSLKEVELEYFLNKNIKNILPIWYGIDKNYIQKKISKGQLPKYFEDLQASQMTSEDDLSQVIDEIIIKMKLSPRKTRVIQRQIKKDHFKEVQILLANLQEDGWEVLNKKSSPQEFWDYQVHFKNIITEEEFWSKLYYYPTRKDAIFDFWKNKNRYGKPYKSRLTHEPNVGEQSYGYIPNDSCEIVTFRTTNMLNTIIYQHKIEKQSIKKAEQMARITDRNIRMMLTDMAI
ncbi:MAG: toll/interleukin-1 receptor domain-containing protein [Methanomicrobiaceae archaeon]|nr:toll/interleukin-1 receptor domain-containing protein [Methanomicrobiaceae archaeon]